jgi:hypothetical protein
MTGIFVRVSRGALAYWQNPLCRCCTTCRQYETLDRNAAPFIRHTVEVSAVLLGASSTRWAHLGSRLRRRVSFGQAIWPRRRVILVRWVLQPSCVTCVISFGNRPRSVVCARAGTKTLVRCSSGVSISETCSAWRATVWTPTSPEPRPFGTSRACGHEEPDRAPVGIRDGMAFGGHTIFGSPDQADKRPLFTQWHAAARRALRYPRERFSDRWRPTGPTSIITVVGPATSEASRSILRATTLM